MNASAVASYLSSRQWAMEPGRLQAIADTIATSLVTLSPESLAAAQEAALRRQQRRDSGEDRGYELRDGVAHIRVEGPILKEVPCIFDVLGIPATSTVATQRALDAALYDESVKSIALDIDSPGGSMDGLVELANDVGAASDLKPVSAHVAGMAASAAYWIASQAGSVTATEGSLVGSIGVYAVMADTSAAHVAAGIRVHVLRSHALKGAGVDGDQITPAQLADEQRIVDEAASMFTAAVARGRGLSAEAVHELATGQVWFASAAMERRLIDTVAKSQQAQGRATGEFKAEEVTAPSVGAEERSMSDTKPTPTGAQADAERIARLEAENAAFKASLEAVTVQRREELVAKYRDRVSPEALASVRKVGDAHGSDLEAFESFLKGLPVVTRDSRVSEAMASAAAQAPTVSAGEKQVAKWLGTKPEHLEKFADVRNFRSDGTFELEDGRVVTKSELRKMKGFGGIAAALAIFIAAAIGIGAPSEAQAAALSAARLTQSKNAGAIKSYLMKASTTIYAGGLVMLDSDGLAVPASALSGNRGVVGVATETKASAASGTYKINAREGWFLFAGTTLAQANQGGLVYAEDDQTVDNVPALNEPVAGVLIEYVSASSGWVLISPDVAALGSSSVADLGNVVAITDAYTLTASDCGRPITVSAGIDTKSITLPDAATVLGCVYKISYIGADAGALVDITPTDAANADGIDGGCTLAASVVNFSGTADADIGLTKASSQVGDYIELTAVADEQWAVTGCQGIWANN